MNNLALKRKSYLKADGSPKRGFTKRGKISKATLTRKADALARKACHARGYCEASFWIKYSQPKTTGGKCGRELQWCHILSRRHKKIRWSPLNCLCMCADCHCYFTDHSAEFGLMVESLYPGRIEFLGNLDRDTKTIDHEYWIKFYEREKTQ